MNSYQCQLWYKQGIKAHQILGLAKAQIAASYALGISDRKLADFVTETISLSQRQNRNFALMSGNNTLEGQRMFDDEIERVHNRLSNDIRNRFEQPMIGTEEFNEVMFASIVKDELEQIAPPQVEIALNL